jgi:uncharacterized protein (TIGR02391 family)
MTTLHPPLPVAVVEAVSGVLGATDWPGLTGSEIARLLAHVNVDDVDPTATKRHRLSNALLARQARDQAGNCIIRFVTEAMAPARHLQDPNRFHELQQGLSESLSLVGLGINDKGQVTQAARADTLYEVAELAGQLRGEMMRRKVHPEALAYCREELLRSSIFHAVFEATKGLAERLRQMSGSELDGAELVDACFGGKQGVPVICINGYETESETSEHRGFANLLKGVFGTFRNPTAHAPRTAWVVTEADALDLFSTLSYLHRRLDNARTTP